MKFERLIFRPDIIKTRIFRISIILMNQLGYFLLIISCRDSYRSPNHSSRCSLGKRLAKGKANHRLIIVSGTELEPYLSIRLLMSDNSFSKRRLCYGLLHFCSFPHACPISQMLRLLVSLGKQSSTRVAFIPTLTLSVRARDFPPAKLKSNKYLRSCLIQSITSLAPLAIESNLSKTLRPSATSPRPAINLNRV
jgi:hypothetical protein